MTERTHRDRRVLWHVLAIAFIVAAACLLFIKNFYQPGTLMHIDMTFPTSISRNFSLYAHTWWPFGSIQNIWNAQRVLWSDPLLAAVKLLGLNTSQYLLILFIGTFALAGASMYALTFSLIGKLKGRLEVTNRYAIYVGAVFAALIFMYNPFSVSHLWPYFGYPGYAVLPLAFLLLLKALDNPRPLYVILLAIVISVAGTGPINVAWFWLLIIAYLVFKLISDRFRKESLLRAVKVILPLAVLYVLLNAAWMLPIVRAQLVSKPFVPLYSPVLTQRGLDMLSAGNSVMNNIRFASGWGLPVNPHVSGTFWVMLSFALPVAAVAGLIALRKKIKGDRTMMFWSLMFVISILLATGSSFILRGPYSYLTLNAPGVNSFGWVFRSADRWLCYAPIFYALVLGLLAAWLFGSKSSLKKSLAVLLVALVLVSFVPIARSYASTVYNPAPVPPDYDAANAFIEKAQPGARPVWVPFYAGGFHYKWAPEKRLGAFDVYSSNANLNNLQDFFAEDSFYNWLNGLLWKVPASPLQVLNTEVMLARDMASRLLTPFSAAYLINDTSVPGYNFKQTFDRDGSLQPVKKTDVLDIYRIKDATPFIRAAKKTVRVGSYYDELAIEQRLSPEQLKGISFSKGGRPIDRKFGVLNMDDFLDYYDINSGFEQVAGGFPAGWTPQQTDASVSYAVDGTNTSGGTRSLRVENRSSRELSVAFVSGPEVPVKAGDVYNIQSSVMCVNSNWTHVAVEGLEVATGQWVRLARCPTAIVGNSPWKKTSLSFYMPAGFSRIRPALAAGWAKDGGRPAVSWFDDVKLARVNDRFFTELVGGEGPTISYTQQGIEKYTVKVKGATAPFILVFGEADDPLWQARTSGGETINPVRLDSVITGFPVAANGDFEITIEYLAQPWFIQGVTVSVTVLIACILFLGIAWLVRRRRRRRTPGGGTVPDAGGGPGPADDRGG